MKSLIVISYISAKKGLNFANYIEMSPLYRTLVQNIILTVFIIFISVNTAFTQTGQVLSTYDGGSVPGSYNISDYESINLFNRSLTFRLPLGEIGGRGSNVVKPSLEINSSNWSSNTFYWSISGGGGGDPYAQLGSVWSVKQSPYEIRVENVGLQYWDCTPNTATDPLEVTQSITFVSIVDSDGVVHRLKDVLTDGRVGSRQRCTSQRIQRGTEFISDDGSGLKYVFDAPIADCHLDFCYDYTLALPNGILFLPDGSKYRETFDQYRNAVGSTLTDRNGNQMNYARQVSNLPTSIVVDTTVTDSLNRQTQVEMRTVFANNTITYEGDVKYKGVGGEPKQITIETKLLGQNIRADYEQRYKPCDELFNPVNTGYYGCGPAYVDIEPAYPSAVILPNGKKFKFFYNHYSELARVELPNGGAVEYDYEETSFAHLHRGIKERRIYSNGQSGANFENKTVYSYPDTGQVTTLAAVDTYDQNLTLIASEKHYFYGDMYRRPVYVTNRPFPYKCWLEGKEYQTEIISPSNSVTVLKRVNTTWIQARPTWDTLPLDYTTPQNNPKIAEVTTTLESGQVSKVSYGYDPETRYNLQTDIYEYDFGNGNNGNLLRRMHTEYEKSSTYIALNVNILRLPKETWVSSDTAGNNKFSFSRYEYDNYTTDSLHAPLVDRTNISQHDSNFNVNNVVRGNLTKKTSYANAQNQTSPVESALQYDIAGNVVKTIDARGSATTLFYDDRFGVADTEARSNTNPTNLNGQQTFAFATVTTNAFNFTAYAQFDYYTGNIVNAEDINGNINARYYNDPFNRPTQTVSAINRSQLKSQTTIAYDDLNRKVMVTSDLNAYNDNRLKSESFHDGLGRNIEIRQYENNTYVAGQTQYDALGRAYKVSNPFRPNEINTNNPIRWTITKFDSLGRVIEVELPDTLKVTNSYSGNRKTVTDQAGRQRSGISDALGRTIQVIEDPNSPGQNNKLNYVTDYTFDALGNLRKTVQGGQTRYFSYDSLSRLLRAKQPEQDANQSLELSSPDAITGNNNWSVGYSYDANGNITTTTDARGTSVTGTYDALNRLAFRDYSDITPDVTFTYDDANVPNSKGLLTAVNSVVSSKKNTGFDELGRITSSQQITDGQTYNMAYTYNLSGALIEETYPSGRVVKNTFNADGKLSQVQSRKANTGFYTYAQSLTYSAAGAVEKMRLGNGKWETVQYNNRLQITQIGLGVTDNTQDLLKLEFGYGTTDNNGAMKSQTLTVPTIGANQGFTAVQTYAYDALNRLESATEITNGNPIPSWKQTFTYDRYGNRGFDAANTTTLEDCPQMVCNPTINTSNNRFLTGQGYSYDLNGNLTRDAQSKKFTYDAENHQTKVETVDAGGTPIGTNGEYLYDGEGKRVKKISNTETVIFVYNGGGQLVAEYSTQTVQTPQVSYLTNDHLGSPRVITDQNGNVTKRQDYTAFGEETYTPQRTIGLGYTTQDQIRQGYTGYQKDDESGLDFAQARYYNSQHGRFTSVDPLTASATTKNPQTFNRYTYVLNSPYKFTDPLGLIYCGGSCDSFGGGARQRANDKQDSWEDKVRFPDGRRFSGEQGGNPTRHPDTVDPGRKPGVIRIDLIEVFTEVPGDKQLPGEPYPRPGPKPVFSTKPESGNNRVEVTAPKGEVFYVSITASIDGDAVFTAEEIPTVRKSSVGNAFEQTTFPGETLKEGQKLKPRTEFSDKQNVTVTFAVTRNSESRGSSTFNVGFIGASTQGPLETTLVNAATNPKNSVTIKIVNPSTRGLP